MRGYLVGPAKPPGKLPGVLVVHENRGLNPHIEDVARRLALEGFMAFAPDALFPLGGYPGDEDEARELFQKLEGQDPRGLRGGRHLAERPRRRHREDRGGRLLLRRCHRGPALAQLVAPRFGPLLAEVAAAAKIEVDWRGGL